MIIYGAVWFGIEANKQSLKLQERKKSALV